MLVKIGDRWIDAMSVKAVIPVVRHGDHPPEARVAIDGVTDWLTVPTSADDAAETINAAMQKEIDDMTKLVESDDDDDEDWKRYS